MVGGCWKVCSIFLIRRAAWLAAVYLDSSLGPLLVSPSASQPGCTELPAPSASPCDASLPHLPTAHPAHLAPLALSKVWPR